MSKNILKERKKKKEMKRCTFNRIVRVIEGRTRDYFLLLQILQIKLLLSTKKKPTKPIASFAESPENRIRETHPLFNIHHVPLWNHDFSVAGANLKLNPTLV